MNHPEEHTEANTPKATNRFTRLKEVLSALLPQERRRQAAVGAALAVLGLVLLVGENLRLHRQLADTEFIDVVAAAHDLQTGDRITRDSIRLRRIPKRNAHPKLILGSQRSWLEGRTIQYDVARNEPLHWYALQGEELGSGRLATLVRKGERAVAIPVDGNGAVGYHVVPGDHVDLFLLVTKLGGRSVVPILQNVTVLAVDRTLPGNTPADRYSRVIFSVTPREAEMLLLAQRMGDVRLLLRRPDDPEAETEFPVLNEHELFGGQIRSELQKDRNQRQRVRVIKGSG